MIGNNFDIKHLKPIKCCFLNSVNAKYSVTYRDLLYTKWINSRPGFVNRLKS